MYVVSVCVFIGVSTVASVLQEVSKGVVGNPVVSVVRPRLIPRVLGVTGSAGGSVTVERNRKLSAIPAGGDATTKVGPVILPVDTDVVLRDFLSSKLTKTKGHNDTTRHFNLWKTFHATKLGGSTDFWLEACMDDEFRAKVVGLFVTELSASGVKEKQIRKILAGVSHQFEVNGKSTSFINNSTLIASLKKAIKPTTSQIREEAIESSQHVKLPMPSDVMDRAHDEGWMKSDWGWDGTLARGISVAADIMLCRGFRASNVVAPGLHGEDHAVRFSDVMFSLLDGERVRRVIVSKGLNEINEADVVSLQAHMYSTKTGAVKGDKIPYTVTRDTALGERLVNKAFLWIQQMVQAPNFNIEDPLCTAYREDSKGRWHRRLIRRLDISSTVKENASAFGIPQQHAASSSLRKTRATDTRLQGGDDQAVADAGGWAKGMSGRSAVAARHYDLASLTGRGGATGTTGVSVHEVLNMIPLRSGKSTKGPTVVSSLRKSKVAHKTITTKKKKATRAHVGLSPKRYNKKN